MAALHPLSPLVYRPIRALLAGLWVCATPAQAMDQVTATALKNYGGSYSSACQNPAAPRLTVYPASLVFAQGGQSITGREVLAAHSYFGNTAPAGFLVAFISQIKGKEQMTFLLYEDPRGRYIQIENESNKLSAFLGPARMAAQYRRCDGPAVKTAPVAAPVATPSADMAPGAAPFSYEVFATPQFKSQFALIAGPVRQVPWLARMEGPNSQVVRVKVGNKEYLRADLCKPQDCHDYNVLFLYAPQRNVLYAQVHQKGQVTLLGDPPRAEAAALGRLWTAQFRSP
nr:Ivy family c-type lysozyme inhibitor [uncultured Albidiferax sp.]